jgi:hypothetical protein
VSVQDAVPTAATPSARFRERYKAGLRDGACPIEAGTLGRLADHECPHGRLPFDGTAACGCWRVESVTP